MSSGQEVYSAAFDSGYPHISYGLPFPQACAKHIDETFHASKVYIIASGSLSRNTDHVKDLEAALGNKVVGVRNGMQPHTLWSECLSIIAQCRDLQADLIVTLGAGSLTDAAKIISLVCSTLCLCPSISTCY